MPQTRRSLVVGGLSVFTLGLAACTDPGRPAPGGTAPIGPGPSSTRPESSSGTSSAVSGATAGTRIVTAQGLKPGTDVSRTLADLLGRTSRSGGGVVRIARPGRYYVHDCALASHVTLRLEKGVVLALPDGSRAISMLRVPDGARSMRIEGGTLDGNRQHYRGDAVNAGDIVYSDNTHTRASSLSIIGVHFVNAPRSGVTTGAGLSGLLIQQCDFRAMTRHAVIAYNTAAVQILDNVASRTTDRIEANTVTFQFWANPGHDVEGPQIRGNRIIGRPGTGAENAFIGIELHADGSGRIQGGTVTDNHITGGSMGVSIANCSGAAVTRNTIASMDYCAVEVASGTGVRVVSNSYDGHGKGSGIRVNNVARKVVIESNRVVHWADRFDRAGIHSNASSISGASIRKNVLRGSYQKSSPMYLANVSDAVISDNDIRVASTGPGLFYIDIRAAGGNCDGNVIRGNHVENTAGSFWTNGMISIAAGSKSQARANRIEDNLLVLAAGSTGLAVSLSAASTGGITGTVISGNSLSGPFTSRIRQQNTTHTDVRF